MNAQLLSIAAAAGLLAASTVVGYAQRSTDRDTPGHQMQENGSAAGHPGASGYAPGHQSDKDRMGSNQSGGKSDRDDTSSRPGMGMSTEGTTGGSRGR